MEVAGCRDQLVIVQCCAVGVSPGSLQVDLAVQLYDSLVRVESHDSLHAGWRCEALPDGFL